MKRAVPLLLSVLCLVQAKPASAGEKEEGWVPLFKGDDLSQWDGLMKHWTLEQAVLTGTNMPKGLPFRTFLCSKKRYKDFEIRFQVWIKGGPTGNSGVNFRSEILDKTKFTVSGPQADMGGDARNNWWGSLSSEFIPGKPSTAIVPAPKAIQAKVKKDGFNDYYVKCVGKRITMKLNGETTVDDNFPFIHDDGIIAFQIHVNPTEVVFRKVEIRAFNK